MNWSVFTLTRIYKRYGLPPKELSPDLMSALQEYDWPGNIRELVNVLETAVVTAGDEPVLFSVHLPVDVRVNMAREKVEPEEPGEEAETPQPAPGRNGARRYLETLPPFQQARDQAVSRAEKEYLEDLTAGVKGDIKTAIAVSGLSRSRLYALLKKHGVSTKG